MTSEGLDKVDKQILKILEKDARLSYSEIGDKVGLSRVSVKRLCAASLAVYIVPDIYTKIRNSLGSSLAVCLA